MSTVAALPLLIADLYEAAGALRHRGDRIASVAGQTQSRWQVLSVLDGGDWTVPKIGRRLGVTRQAVQRTADQLRDDGLVEFESNPDHERSPLLRLTRAGCEALTAITAAADDWHDLAAGGLSSDELEVTRRVLRALTAAASR
jgi:DNA-binding MarR family transcriptional regulator